MPLGGDDRAGAPTILLNDTPFRHSDDFASRGSAEEAGLISHGHPNDDDDDEGFFYDRQHSRKHGLFSAAGRLLSSAARSIGLSSGGLKARQRRSSTPSAPKRRGLRRLFLVLVAILAVLGVLQLAQIAYSAAITLFPNHPNHVLASWEELGRPGSEGLEHWPTDFTRDVLPIACHSHNDYWRAVPLFSGVSAGCIGTEADVWLQADGSLLVGHDPSSLTANRTLQALYLEPLMDLLQRQNPGTTAAAAADAPLNGVFDTSREQILTLLIDFKTADEGTFEAVVSALDPLRQKGYLTHFGAGGLVERPLRVVASGEARFESVLSDERNPHRDIFLDAPLRGVLDEQKGHHGGGSGDGDSADQASNDERRPRGKSDVAPFYSPANSYYASGSFTDLVGHMWGWSLTAKQMHHVRAQVKAAHARGLKARYWDTPAWPVSRRNRLWEILVEEGADILNVDDLKGAVEEDWRRAGRWWG